MSHEIKTALYTKHFPTIVFVTISYWKWQAKYKINGTTFIIMTFPHIYTFKHCVTDFSNGFIKLFGKFPQESSWVNVLKIHTHKKRTKFHTQTSNSQTIFWCQKRVENTIFWWRYFWSETNTFSYRHCRKVKKNAHNETSAMRMMANSNSNREKKRDGIRKKKLEKNTCRKQDFFLYAVRMVQ